MSDDRPSDADVARQAAINTLVSQLVYLAVMFGFAAAITKRDAIGRLVLRWKQWREPRPVECGDALHEVRRDIARFEGREP